MCSIWFQMFDSSCECIYQVSIKVFQLENLVCGWWSWSWKRLFNCHADSHLAECEQRYSIFAILRLIVSMAPMCNEVRLLESCHPPHLGPVIPEVNSVWFKLFLYHHTGHGPTSLFLTQGSFYFHIFFSTGVHNTNYRCEDGRFLVSASCVTIQNLQQGNKAKSWNKKLKIKKALIWLSVMWESYWWHIVCEKVKSWDFTTWFRIWQFQTPAWKWYLQIHLLAERFGFGVDNWGFLKEGVKTYQMPNVASQTAIFISVFTSIVYGSYSCCHGNSRSLYSFSSCRIFVGVYSWVVELPEACLERLLCRYEAEDDTRLFCSPVVELVGQPHTRHSVDGFPSVRDVSVQLPGLDQRRSSWHLAPPPGRLKPRRHCPKIQCLKFQITNARSLDCECKDVWWFSKRASFWLCTRRVHFRRSCSYWSVERISWSV